MIKDITECLKMLLVVFVWLGLYSLSVEAIGAYKAYRVEQNSLCFPFPEDDVDKDVDMSPKVES